MNSLRDRFWPERPSGRFFGDDSSSRVDRFYCHVDTNTHSLFIAFSTGALGFEIQVEMLIRKLGCPLLIQSTKRMQTLCALCQAEF